MVRKVKEEKPIPLGQVYEFLQMREESGINYVQRVTAQHAENLSRNAAYSEEVLEMLQSEFELSRLLAVQLVNLNPKNATDVKAVTRDRLTDEQVEQLLERYSGFVLKVKAAIEKAEEEADEEPTEIDETYEDL
ncbi:MAG: hypothetical protein ACW98F_06585 [Candidatus Hodarchaeales archaeon]